MSPAWFTSILVAVLLTCGGILGWIAKPEGTNTHTIQVQRIFVTQPCEDPNFIVDVRWD